MVLLYRVTKIETTKIVRNYYGENLNKSNYKIFSAVRYRNRYYQVNPAGKIARIYTSHISLQKARKAREMVLHRPSTLYQKIYRSPITSYRQKITRTVSTKKCSSYYVFSSDCSKGSSPFISPAKKQSASRRATESKSRFNNKPLLIVFTWSQHHLKVADQINS